MTAGETANSQKLKKGLETFILYVEVNGHKTFMMLKGYTYIPIRPYELNRYYITFCDDSYMRVIIAILVVTISYIVVYQYYKK